MAATVLLKRTTGTTVPTGLVAGELGMSLDSESPRLYTAKNNGETAIYVDKDYVDNLNGSNIYLNGYAQTTSGQSVMETDSANLAIAKLEAQISALLIRVAALEGHKVSFSIANALTNVETSNPTLTVEDGDSYTATLSISQSGYIWDKIQIMMGGIDITEQVFDESTNTITIDKVTNNVLITASAKASKLSIVNNLTHATTNNSITEIEYGEPYNAIITAEDQYTLISLTVTMGGVAVPVNDGIIAIDSVTGDVEITARAVSRPYTVTNNLTHVVTNNTTDVVSAGDSYSAILTPDEGYELSNVVVLMGGVRQYAEGGVIEIANITGDIVITAEAQLKVFSVINNLTNTTTNNQATSATYGTSYSAVLSPNKHYALNFVYVEMGGERVRVEDGQIDIPFVTGNIEITAVSNRQMFTVTYNLDNATSSYVITEVEAGSSFETVISANEHYTLDEISVEMGGYNVAVNGSMVSIAEVTGNIIINATTSKIGHEISYALNNASSDNMETSVFDGESYVANISADEHYKIDSVVILMNGVNITSSAYNDGIVNITSVSGPVTITVNTSLIEYTITYNLSNVSSSNNASVIYDGESFDTLINADKYYHIGQVVVTVGGVDVTNRAYVDNSINLSNVNGDIVITANAIRNSYSIIYTLNNAISSNNNASIEAGLSYTTTISADAHYVLDDVQVLMAGVDITDSAVAGNVITIPEVTGQVEIIAKANKISYTVTYTLSNVESTNDSATAFEGETFETVLTPLEHYRFANVIIMVNGVNMTSAYYQNGRVNVTNVNGNIEITASAEIITYTITNNLTSCTNSNVATVINEAENYVATIEAIENYKINSVEILVGGVNITDDVYNNGEINITNVMGDIVINAAAIEFNVTEIGNVVNSGHDVEILDGALTAGDYYMQYEDADNNPLPYEDIITRFKLQ